MRVPTPSGRAFSFSKLRDVKYGMGKARHIVYDGNMQIAVRDAIIHLAFSGAPIASAKQVVIFLHGWGRTMDDFDGLAKLLSEQMPNTAFIRLDLPGFGGSPLNQKSGLSLDDYCAVISDLMDKMETPRAALIGHSLGGRIAIKFAALHPDRTEKLVLISAAGIPPQSFRIKLLAAGRTAFQTLFHSVRDYRYILRLKNLLGAVFGSHDYQVTHGALRETLKKALAEDLRPDAANIKIPTLLIWGAHDPITPLSDGEQYHTLISGSQLKVIDGGHFVFLERGKECGNAIASFLQNG